MKYALAYLATFSSLTVCALQACGGDSSVSDAGPDGTTNDAAADVSKPDVVPGEGGACPTYTGSVELCKGIVARCNACQGAVKFSTCDLANLDAVCNWANTVFSTQYQVAVASCASICDQDAETACDNAALADASLSTAQQKMVTDYCARCAQDAGCAASIAKTLNVLELSDGISTQIDTTCTPDAGGPDSSACAFGYLNCYGTIVQKALAGNPCDGG